MRHINKEKEAAFLALPEHLRNRLWLNFHSTGHCWRWATPTREPYPAVRVGGLKLQGNRAAWLAAFGAIPDGMLVCHRCDNTKCINPDHLYLGTQVDNMDDRSRRGRHWLQKNPRLSSIHNWNDQRRKLQDSDIPVIRRMLTAGQTQTAIAKHFGVGRTTIHAIRAGRIYSHVQAPDTDWI